MGIPVTAEVRWRNITLNRAGAIAPNANWRSVYANRRVRQRTAGAE